MSVGEIIKALIGFAVVAAIIAVVLWPGGAGGAEDSYSTEYCLKTIQGPPWNAVHRNYVQKVDLLTECDNAKRESGDFGTEG
jgi:hypothetical protein